MRKAINKLALALALALVGGLITALPASAQVLDEGHVTGVCSVTGTADIVAPGAPAVPLTGTANGNYSFTELIFACGGAVNDEHTTDPAQTEPVAAVFDVSSTGTWGQDGGVAQLSPAPCGFGFAESTTSTGTAVAGQTQPAAHEGDTITAPYRIDFDAGVGRLTFEAPASGGGVIDIIPLSPDPENNVCTDQFAVEGTVAILDAPVS